MNVIFSPTAWSQYVEWQTRDKNTVKKINDLISDIGRNGLSRGVGKPEFLKWRKVWSRRIDQEHRLAYIGDRENLMIVACMGHYED